MCAEVVVVVVVGWAKIKITEDERCCGSWANIKARKKTNCERVGDGDGDGKRLTLLLPTAASIFL